jgi:UDP-GlcNAc3NAcA epimerase
MLVLTIVGARPQFIKAAAVSSLLRRRQREILLHTGQHYDDGMSDRFFRELNLPAPDYELNVGSGSHGEQTGRMLEGIEPIIVKERPDVVLVYGDTNSTLAGALAATKLRVKVAHVEAGLRSFNRRMPEETNRVVVDHVADLLFCPHAHAAENLAREGVTSGVHVVGDVMADVLATASSRNVGELLRTLGVEPGRYVLVTVHRAENADNPERLAAITAALAQLKEPVLFPVHPRVKKMLGDYRPPAHVRLVEPLGYFEMIAAEKHARVVLTDSGGVQKEAAWLGVPCVTLRDETEWVETVRIVAAARVAAVPAKPMAGVTGAAEAIVKHLSI